MKNLLLACALVVVLAFAPQRASAQTCTASMSTLDFGSVSPIASAAVNATGTLTVTCNWSVVSLAPTALVCLNLTPATPRYLTDTSSDKLRYDLYQDSARSLSWGSTSAGTTPISVTLTQPLLTTSASTTVTVYGQIAANQPTVPTLSNSNTLYTHVFSGAETSINYAYYVLGILGPPSCASITSGGTFGFTVNATVINNCNISATNIAFTATSLLNQTLTANGTITAQCTAGDAYKIALSAGSSGTTASRTMQRSGGGGTVKYQLYTDAALAGVWGDGTGGTTVATGVGTGNPASVTVYGVVPSQSTPAPGNYSDTITATIYF
ncbi:spore coat U domain-containing protein [Paraburkholderia sp.]|uniref:Csu type fimbrial protein n=1 Tax=Paraburkholderia sp. TaxID=1926495 RepID=UPI0023843AF4|nr:spore coat U domain-containing protein [Paraburkholderia sp.]MDE1182788.1 spore coat U domain-containing protein [Paraburkholderia sp.]